MKDFEYHSPATLEEACQLLKKYDGQAKVLAGGTDLIPGLYRREIVPEQVINIKGIPSLNFIANEESKGLVLGSLVTFNEIISSPIIEEHYPILKEVAEKIASHQVRNLATIGGNLCNAAPSADSAPILIALDSTVALIEPGGKERTLPLEKFFIGPGETALAPGEILIQVHIPLLKPRTGVSYLKQTSRQALEIAVVGVAALVRLEKKTEKCSLVRLVIGACASTPLRIPAAEKILVGKKIGSQDIEAAAKAASEAVKPITDVRASKLYRKEMVRVQCKRSLEEAISRAKSSPETGME
ncbi:MAG: xanthine dehydrogenase family protein subunit M [Candidatus Aminicenantes bacterium]|nr:xanthine dehydrogenase family protein subunit M [Candidatus Aminicenantes bacterium]